MFRPDFAYVVTLLIGATRESGNKLLHQFRRHDWLRFRHGQIIIVDPEALRMTMNH